MKTVTVPARAKTLNALFKQAHRRNVILESATGERFVLASITNWEGFDVGNSDDFAVEVKHTAQNKKLAQRMAERRKEDQGRPTISLEQVRQELGIE